MAPGAADPATVILGGTWRGDPKRDTFSGVRFQHDTRTDEGVPAEHVEGITAGPQGLLVRGRGAPWHALERAIQRIERIQLDTPAEFAGRVLDTFTTALSDAGIDDGRSKPGSLRHAPLLRGGRRRPAGPQPQTLLAHQSEPPDGWTVTLDLGSGDGVNDSEFLDHLRSELLDALGRRSARPADHRQSRRRQPAVMARCPGEQRALQDDPEA